MNPRRLPKAAALLLLAAALQPWHADDARGGDERADDARAATRLEARSDDLLAVGIVKGDRMSIHVSRLADNAPVRDATISVMLRGVVHATVVDPDGSYALETKDLELPGAATVEFQVARAQSREVLKAEFAPAAADPSKSADRNGARQLWWWVLNFAVCIAFLWLWSARRKAAGARERAGED